MSRFDISPMPLLPICAVCGREVERLIEWPRPDRDAVVFEAICHGEIEKTEIRAIDMEMAHPNAGGALLSPGVAFSKSKLLEAR